MSRVQYCSWHCSAHVSAGPWQRAYEVNQFVPLLIFFFVFLVVVRNKKLHHFVRFNAMQAMMCDILVMLPIITQRCAPCA